MTSSLFDTHCHLDVSEFSHDWRRQLALARGQGVVALLVPAVSRAGWQHLSAVVASDASLHAAYGLHPCYLAEHDPVADADALGHWLEATPAVAVGECGLDFFIQDTDPAAQEALLMSQLSVARSLSLPVILHARRSHDRLLLCLRRAGVTRGIVHAWSGSEEQARRFVDAGFLLGFGGAATFERALKLRRLLQSLPLESVVLETDAPDIPPAFARGERNTPAHLPQIAGVLAEVRGIPAHELALATTRNAARLFGLSIPAGAV